MTCRESYCLPIVKANHPGGQQDYKALLWMSLFSTFVNHVATKPAELRYLQTVQVVCAGQLQMWGLRG